MQDNLNYLEKKWKTRVLIEYTPRGNIIMYYNPYKMGFSYYCDSTGIPYPILNAVAMKFVIMFNCRDFFIDECFIQNLKNECPLVYDSPLIPIYFIENEKKSSNVKTSIKIKSSKCDQNTAPFAKLKDYKLYSNITTTKMMNSLPSHWIINKIAYYIDKTRTILIDSITKHFAKPTVIIKDIPIENSKKVTPTREYNYNRFIRIGNVKDYNILQTQKDYSKVNGFQSNLLENLVTETKLQKQVMSYNDYKNL